MKDQWKDKVHIFHLIPSGTLCEHWSGHRDALKTGPILYKNFFLQRVDGFPYVEASMQEAFINFAFALWDKGREGKKCQITQNLQLGVSCFYSAIGP